MQEPWVETDETLDVAGSVRHVVRCIGFCDDDPLAWKWLLLAAHSALQGACVCHLTTTAQPVGPLSKRNTLEWLAHLNDGAAIPKKTELMSFRDLLKAVRKAKSAGGPSTDEDIAINDSELAWLVRFHNEIRNQFVHFQPRGWAIEVSGIPEIVALMARIIGDIADRGWGFRHLEPEQLDDMRSDLKLLTDWSVNAAGG